MAIAIFRMDVIGKGSAEGFLDLKAGDFGPGGIEEHPQTGLVDLKDDLFDVFDDGAVFEFADAQRFGGAFALDAHGYAVGHGAHFLENRFRERLGAKYGHNAERGIFENQGIGGKGRDTFFRGPLMVKKSRTGREMIDEDRPAFKQTLLLERDFWAFAAAGAGIADGAGSSPKLKWILLAGFDPNSRQASLEKLHHGRGATLQDRFERVRAREGEANLRAKGSQTGLIGGGNGGSASPLHGVADG